MDINLLQNNIGIIQERINKVMAKDYFVIKIYENDIVGKGSFGVVMGAKIKDDEDEENECCIKLSITDVYSEKENNLSIDMSDKDIGPFVHYTGVITIFNMGLTFIVMDRYKMDCFYAMTKAIKNGDMENAKQMNDNILKLLNKTIIENKYCIYDVKPTNMVTNYPENCDVRMIDFDIRTEDIENQEKCKMLERGKPLEAIYKLLVILQIYIVFMTCRESNYQLEMNLMYKEFIEVYIRRYEIIKRGVKHLESYMFYFCHYAKALLKKKYPENVDVIIVLDDVKEYFKEKLQSLEQVFEERDVKRRRVSYGKSKSVKKSRSFSVIENNKRLKKMFLRAKNKRR